MSFILNSSRVCLFFFTKYITCSGLEAVHLVFSTPFLDTHFRNVLILFTLVIGLINLRSTLQFTMTLSTTEVDHMVVTETFKERIWLLGLFDDLGFFQEYLGIHYDSQSTIKLAKNQVYHSRKKYIDVRFHFIWKILDEGDIFFKKNWYCR